MEVNMETEKSRNLFVYDNPIGRKQFLINTLIIMAIAFAIAVLFAVCVGVIKYVFSINVVTLYIITILTVLLIIFIQYLVIINEAKRLCDITSDKTKALLYVILFVIFDFSLASLPKTVILSKVLYVAFFIFLLFKKGNMLQIETLEEENVNDDEQSE